LKNLTSRKTFSAIEDLTLGDAAGTQAHNAIGSDAGNVLTGNAAANKIYGLGGNDVLIGGAGKDLLDGGLGDDTLTGGTGADTLAGGGGSDRFVFTQATDSGLDTARDVIKDFAAGDLVDLRSIDADVSMYGDQPFTFIGSAAFSPSNATAQLRYADGVLYASTDADAQAEFEIALTNKPNLTLSDFLL
jgi:Ca2+-binding RTX toxin-like protein